MVGGAFDDPKPILFQNAWISGSLTTAFARSENSVTGRFIVELQSGGDGSFGGGEAGLEEEDNEIEEEITFDDVDRIERIVNGNTFISFTAMISPVSTCQLCTIGEDEKIYFSYFFRSKFSMRLAVVVLVPLAAALSVVPKLAKSQLSSIENLKVASKYLLDPLNGELADDRIISVNKDAMQILKYHGSYMQSNREHKRTKGELVN